jgi:dTDP-4-dehydrorhamnose reductase
MKKIIILGANGMLGQMVTKYFRLKKYDVTIINEKFDEISIFSIIEEINKLEDSIVVNCIGKIKQKTVQTAELIWSNTILPLELNRTLKKSHFLIHPSTDCVFAGNQIAPYNVDDKPDAQDVYGWSKSLGEIALSNRENTLIFRVSIIGPDIYSSKGLLSWFLNYNDSSELYGFSNHYWNGITTLEWCERLNHLVESDELYLFKTKNNLLQFGTFKKYSKLQMLQIFKSVFNKNITIVEKNEGSRIVSKCLIPMVESKDLESQIHDLKSFIQKYPESND